MVTSFAEFMNRLKIALKKQNAKTWRKSRCKCNNCGHEWTAVYPYVPGKQDELECPKCKARNCDIVG